MNRSLELFASIVVGCTAIPEIGSDTIQPPVRGPEYDTVHAPPKPAAIPEPMPAAPGVHEWSPIQALSCPNVA